MEFHFSIPSFFQHTKSGGVEIDRGFSAGVGRASLQYLGEESEVRFFCLGAIVSQNAHYLPLGLPPAPGGSSVRFLLHTGGF